MNRRVFQKRVKHLLAAAVAEHGLEPAVADAYRPPRTPGASPVAAEVRQRVRNVLTASPAFRALPPAEQREIARNL